MKSFVIFQFLSFGTFFPSLNIPIPNPHEFHEIISQWKKVLIFRFRLRKIAVPIQFSSSLNLKKSSIKGNFFSYPVNLWYEKAISTHGKLRQSLEEIDFQFTKCKSISEGNKANGALCSMFLAHLIELFAWLRRFASQTFLFHRFVDYRLHLMRFLMKFYCDGVCFCFIIKRKLVRKLSKEIGRSRTF